MLTSQERIISFPNGEEKAQTFHQLKNLLEDNDKVVRFSAAKEINDILLSVRKVAEAEINAVVGNHAVNDELRGFCRADAARHFSDDISSAAVDAMLKAVSDRYDISHRFYRLKAKLLGVPNFTHPEHLITYGQVNQNYDWETSVRLVHDIYNELDPEFGAIFQKFLKEGLFDVYPRPGKSLTPMSIAFTKTVPGYILLNHNDTLYDVVVLAHEFGHGLHNELMRKEQNALHIETPIPTSTAEAVAQYLEDFCYDRLLTQADDETRLTINMHRLGSAVASIHSSVSVYRFEQNLHATYRQKGYLSADEIGALFQKERAAYLGTAVKLPAGSENWWIQWTHVRDFFYSYAYAWGLLIAKSMQNLTKQDTTFISNFKEFLSAGVSVAPQELYAKIGIDFTDERFWYRALEEVEKLLDETEQLAHKLGKLSPTTH